MIENFSFKTFWMVLNYHLFLAMKTWPATHFLDNNTELCTSVNQWLNLQTAGFYREAIEKLVPHYDKA